MSLSNKQRAFVEHYLTCWNATEAARRAGYSVKTARSIGSENLTKPDIQAEIALHAGNVKATANEVLLRLASHARGNMDDFLSPMGLVDLVKARENGVMPLVKKIKQRTTTVSKTTGEEWETHEIELELYDAQAATVQLAKILNQYVTRIEVSDWRDVARAVNLDPDALVAELFGKVQASE